MKKPYISINKLAEYMTANPLRRRQIITALKKDSDFIKVRYYEVRNIIVPFFKSEYDSSILDTTIKKIEEKVKDTTWTDSDDPNSILALNNLKSAELPDLSEYSIIDDSFNLKSINIAGVDVTIKPELYFANNLTKKVGALKMHIAKTPENQLKEENRLYASTLIKYAFLQSGFSEKEIDNNACISLDIFQKEYSFSPAAFKRKVDALTASCEEIALRWDTI